MLVTNCTKFNFGARRLKLPNVYVKQQNLEEKVNFAEINTNNHEDMTALDNIAKYWLYAKYAPTIAYTAKLKQNNPQTFKDTRIFVLTKQNNCFKNLDDEKILGIVEIEKQNKDLVYINYIQSNPKYIYSLSKDKITGCGSAMLDCLKHIYNNKFLILNSSGADSFYEKNGFVLIPNTKNKYAWCKNINNVNKYFKLKSDCYIN